MYLDFIKHPEEMTDEELEAEYKVVHSDDFYACFEADYLSPKIKSDLLEHKNEVIQEKRFRDGESAFYPVMTFGFLDM